MYAPCCLCATHTTRKKFKLFILLLVVLVISFAVRPSPYCFTLLLPLLLLLIKYNLLRTLTAVPGRIRSADCERGRIFVRSGKV